jgi:hypothetical protein
VESPDRFARDLAVQLAGHDHLRKLGVTLIPATALHRRHAYGSPGASGAGQRVDSIARRLCTSPRLRRKLQRFELPRSAGQRWRLVNKACIVDLLDKKVRHVGARDEPGAPVAWVD